MVYSPSEDFYSIFYSFVFLRILSYVNCSSSSGKFNFSAYHPLLFSALKGQKQQHRAPPYEINAKNTSPERA
jgi:hypothetical protein